MVTKAQARKNLKKAAELYKKTVRQPVTIEFQEEHLNVVIRALEVFQRLKLGQIDYALSEAFDQPIDYEDRKAIHEFTRDRLFKDEELGGNYNASWGIFNQEKVGDATLGYEVQKVLRRYKAFQRNNGWADWGRDFDDPMQHTKVPLPVVQGFIDYKDFKIPKRLWKKLDEAYANKETADWVSIWKAIDKAMPNKPKGEKSEIVNLLWDVGTTDSEWVLRITAPIKPEEI